MPLWKHSRRSRNNPKSSDEAERPLLSSNSDQKSSSKNPSFSHSHKDKHKRETSSKTPAELFDERYRDVYKPLYSRVFVKLQELQSLADNERMILNDLEIGCDLLPHEDNIWEYKGYCSDLDEAKSKLKQARENGSNRIKDLEVEEKWAKEYKEELEKYIEYRLKYFCQAFNLCNNIVKDANTSAQSLSSKSQVIEDYEYLLKFWRKRDFENLAKSIELLKKARSYQMRIFDNDYWENRCNKFIQELSDNIAEICEKVEDLRWSESKSVKVLEDNIEQELKIIKEKIDNEFVQIHRQFGIYDRNKETVLKNVQTLWENEQIKQQLKNTKLEDKSHTESKREHSEDKSKGHKLRK